MSTPYRQCEPRKPEPVPPKLVPQERDVEADEVVGVRDVPGPSVSRVGPRRMDVLVALVIVATTVAFVLAFRPHP